MSMLPTRVNASINFHTLEGFVLNESSGDEPFLWTFFLKIDGDNVANIGTGFVSSVIVHSAPGSHGNLGVEDLRKPGDGILPAKVSIPNALGAFSTTLRPIRVVPPIPVPTVIWVPGQLIAITVLLEEDLNPATSVMEKTRQDLRLMIEDEVNTVIQGFHVLELHNESQATNKAIETLVNERIGALQGSLRTKTRDLIIVNFLSWRTPGFFWENFDLDDFIGFEVFRLNDRDLIKNNPGNQKLSANLEQEDFEGRYRISGDVTFTPRKMQNEVEQTGRLVESTVFDRGQHTYAADVNKCLKAGQTAEWNLLHQIMEEEFIFPHPFLQLAMSVGGAEVPDGPVGSVEFETTCSFPKFDPELVPMPGRTTKTQIVKISFERFSRHGLPGIRFKNFPVYGEFVATLKVHARLGDLTTNFVTPVRALVFEQELVFTGQLVDCPLYQQVFECMVRFTDPIPRLPLPKRPYFDNRELWNVTEQEIWSAAERQVAFEAHLAAASHTIRRFEGGKETLAQLETALRQRYRL